MAVGLDSPGRLFPVAGIRLAAAHCGIKADAVDDLTLIEIESGSSVAAVFTSNRFCAAPVTLARQHLLQNASPRYLLINSGNANAGTGEEGMRAATSSCAAVAQYAAAYFFREVVLNPRPGDHRAAVETIYARSCYRNVSLYCARIDGRLAANG